MEIMSSKDQFRGSILSFYWFVDASKLQSKASIYSILVERLLLTVKDVLNFAKYFIPANSHNHVKNIF